MKKIRIIAAVLFTALCMGCSMNTKEGVAFLEEGKYEEAIACFEAEIREEKNLAEAYRGMAIANFELENYQSAIQNFEEAIQAEAEETAALYVMKATSHLKLDELENALAAYQKALGLEPADEMKQEILFNEIAIYQELGDWETVKEKVAAYVEIYPDDIRMDKTVEFLETR